MRASGKTRPILWGVILLKPTAEDHWEYGDDEMAISLDRDHGNYTAVISLLLTPHRAQVTGPDAQLVLCGAAVAILNECKLYKRERSHV